MTFIKSTFFTRIIDETSIEVKESFAVTVERLMQQQGKCRETDSHKRDLEFLCDKDGKMRICYFRSQRWKREYNRAYCVVGEVIEEDQTTKVKIYSIHNRSYLLSNIIAVILDILVLSIYLIFIFASDYKPSKKDIFIIFLLFSGIIYSMYLEYKEKSYKNNDLEIMKNEIIKRVKAIDRWYD